MSISSLKTPIPIAKSKLIMLQYTSRSISFLKLDRFPRASTLNILCNSPIFRFNSHHFLNSKTESPTFRFQNNIFESLKTNTTAKPYKMAQSQSPELVCLGNPLLDIQVDTNAEFLAKYNLKSNDAILIEDSSKDPRMEIFQELIKNDKSLYIAGGAAQNTARGAAYILGKGKVGYFGCVGEDQFSEQLLKENEKAGVVSMYQIDQTHGTGKCAALITGIDRSLVTDLGAANHFKPEHLDKHWDVVEKAKAFYIGGFHLTVSPEAIIKLGKHAQETNKPFVLNFSAPFIPQFFKSQLESVLPYATHVIANESEAESFAESFALDIKDKTNLEAIATEILKLFPYKNTNGEVANKTIIFTHGTEPTVAVTSSSSSSSSIEVPVHPLEASKIKDTNGAGDAFASGFMAGIVLGDSLQKSIDRGQWLAKLSIQEVGASFPSEKIAYN